MPAGLKSWLKHQRIKRTGVRVIDNWEEFVSQVNNYGCRDVYAKLSPAKGPRRGKTVLQMVYRVVIHGGLTLHFVDSVVISHGKAKLSPLTLEIEELILVGRSDRRRHDLRSCLRPAALWLYDVNGKGFSADVLARAIHLEHLARLCNRHPSAVDIAESPPPTSP